MKTHTVSLILLTTLAILASVTTQARLPAQAASGLSYQVFLPVISRPITFHQVPKPLNMPVLLDIAHTSSSGASTASLELDETSAAEGVIPVSGGVLTATAADGAIFTLTIPDGALVADTPIRMIPVAAINGHGLGGAVGAAVQLEPDGLQLYRDATLVITPTASISVEQELAISWHADGNEFHRAPLELSHPYPQVAFSLRHFSGDGYISEVDAIPIKDDFPIPSDPEDQYRQAVEELIRRERQAIANGQEGDPSFHQKMIDILRAYYNEIIRPIMKAAETDCDYAKRGAISKGMSWARQADLLRAEGELEQERVEVDESFIKALTNCWKVTTEPCLNWNDVSHVQAVLWIAREGQMRGLDFNPQEVPECTCASYWDISAWELTITATFNRQARAQHDNYGGWTEASVDRTQSGVFLLGNKKGWPPYPGWDNGPGTPSVPTGSASIHDSGSVHESNGKTYNYSTNGSGIVGGYAYLELDELNCTYDLGVDMSTHVTETATDYPPKEKNLLVIDLQLRDWNAYTDTADRTLSGQADLDAGSGAYVNQGMYLNYGIVAGLLYNILGNGVGYGHVTWTLRPIP